MESFPSNSKNPLGENKPTASRNVEEKVVTKVVTVDAVKRPKSLGRKFKDLFGGGEVKGAARYVFGDVLVPALKNLVVDATSKGMERVVYGNDPRRIPRPGQPRYSYNNPPSVMDRFAQRPGILPGQPPGPYGRQRRQDAGEILMNSRQDAELVLERLSDIIDKFEVASIADLNELVGLPSSHVDNKWGWTILNPASVRQVREGFLLDLPPVEPI